MERSVWLDHMRARAETLYDHFAPLYWVKWGRTIDAKHAEFLRMFLDRVPPHSRLLSAACGAGLYDGLLLEAGHSVVGIDQSAGMLARAHTRLPAIEYAQMRLQEIDFQAEFDGIICIDALEHVCPEDWPHVLARLHTALRPDGLLYFTVDPGGDNVQDAFVRAQELGLPVVFGEVVDQVDEAYAQVIAMAPPEVPGELADVAVYHYHPALAQVRTWLEQAGFEIEAQAAGTGDEHWPGYVHFLTKKV